MEIVRLEFDNNEPVTATFTMSVHHIAVLTKLIGKMSFNDAGEQSWPTVHETYDLFTGEIFNRFWDDGINDYFKEH